MRTRDEDSTPVPNAFTAEYLELLAERDEPVTAAEADVAGPWHLEAHPSSGWAVLRQGESLESSQPVAIFSKKDAARLAAAVLPSTGRRSRYRLGKDPDALGYPVYDDAQVVGHFERFHEDLVVALNVVDALVSSLPSRCQPLRESDPSPSPGPAGGASPTKPPHATPHPNPLPE